MNNQSIPFDAIDSFVKLRETDLVLAASEPPYAITLRAQFNGYGHFFSILAADVEYVDCHGQFTVGECRLLSDAALAVSVGSKWKWLESVVSGPALMMRSADSTSWDGARDSQLALLVANRLVFVPGADWDAELARLGGAIIGDRGSRV
jgi:hypothetical protein